MSKSPFKKVIGKRCNTQGCKVCGDPADIHLAVCNECGLPLAEDTVLNKPVAEAALAVTALLVSGGSYLAVLKVKAYLAWKTVTVVTETVKRIPEQLSKLPISSPAVWEGELKSLLGTIYADGVKTPEEEGKLTEFSRQHNISAGQLDPYEREPKGKAEQALVYIQKGLSHAQKGDYQAAVEQFLQTIKIDPDRVDAWTNLGVAYQAQRDYVKALEAYTQAGKLDPDNWHLHYNLGTLYSILKNNNRAFDELGKALEHAPGESRENLLKALRQDSDLARVRGDPRFARLLADNASSR